MASILLLMMRVLPIILVSALRHYEDGSSGASKVRFVDDALGLDLGAAWPAATPRYGDEGEALGATSAVEVKLNKESCENGQLGKLVSTGEVLGEGAFGTVYKVRTVPSLKEQSKYFALKVPHARKGAVDSAEREKRIMRATSKHNCKHVLPLLEEDPCVDGVRQAHGILTRLAKWDLETWKEQTGFVQPKCAEPVYDAIDEGLKCMHEAGYVHGDIKGPNILFEDLDENGCPTGIQLSDFGMSGALGNFRPKYNVEFYRGSAHLPPCMFSGAPDPLGLSGAVKKGGREYEFFKVDPRLDDCSFAAMMWDLFRSELPEMQERLGKGACGPMGPGRILPLP